MQLIEPIAASFRWVFSQFVEIRPNIFVIVLVDLLFFFNFGHLTIVFWFNYGGNKNFFYDNKPFSTDFVKK